jgi:hypothetical protein
MPFVLGIKITKGLLPQMPDYVPDELSKIMNDCWKAAKCRPSIESVRDKLMELKSQYAN